MVVNSCQHYDILDHWLTSRCTLAFEPLDREFSLAGTPGLRTGETSKVYVCRTASRRVGGSTRKGHQRTMLLFFCSIPSRHVFALGFTTQLLP